MPKSIAVLFHRKTPHYDVKKYDISPLSDIWRKDGHKVSFLFGTDRFIPADVCIVHIDLSVVPKEYLEFAHQYPIVINGNITDIRKSRISKNLITGRDSYSGPVIVKSDLNHGGWPERKLAHSLPALVTLRLMHKLGFNTARSGSQDNYKVYDLCSQVPEAVFNNPEYIVEKLFTELDGEHYCVNLYKFFGDIGNAEKTLAKSPIITATNTIERQYIEPHPGILEIRDRINIDFGKLDYVIHNGEVVLLDINKTVSTARKQVDRKYREMIQRRATGLYSMI